MAKRSEDFADLSPGDLPEQMTYRDIADLLEVQVQTLHQYRYKDASFPKKVADVRSGIFRGEDVLRWVQSRNSGGPKYSSSAEELIVPGRELFSFDDLAQIVGVSAASLRTYKYGYDRRCFRSRLSILRLVARIGRNSSRETRCESMHSSSSIASRDRGGSRMSC